MRLVLDASVAIEVALRRSKGRQFAALLEEAGEVLAPELLVSEVVDTVWKYHQFENLDLATCDRALDLALDLVDLFVPCKQLYRQGFFLARIARRPPYDMFYLALARREDAAFLTTDAALRKEAERQGIRTL